MTSLEWKRGVACWTSTECGTQVLLQNETKSTVSTGRPPKQLSLTVTVLEFKY